MIFSKKSPIFLRATEPEDLDFIYATENDPLLWNISNTIAPYSKQTLEEYLKFSTKDIFETKSLRLMISIKSSKETAGIIDLFNFEPIHFRAEIGIFISEQYREQGYASEAISLLTDYAFRYLKLNQMYCNIIEGHQRSIRLFESHGFENTGTKKNWINTPSGFKDVLFFSLFSS
ncbi:MAG: GNAT family N-acetyltransferase [Bacteroidota bacterium]|nr:GNAT family N-acetyltransferase [Bacteroidota bacterium]